MRSFQDLSGHSDRLARRETASGLAWSVLFSVIEISAVVIVLAQIRVPAVQAAALAFVLSGALLAIWPEWQKICSLLCPAARRGAGHDDGGSLGAGPPAPTQPSG